MKRFGQRDPVMEGTIYPKYPVKFVKNTIHLKDPVKDRIQEKMKGQYNDAQLRINDEQPG
jgi:hypothetical protein